MSTRSRILSATAAVAAVITLGATGTSAMAQTYAGSAPSTAVTLGATASPAGIQLPVYGTTDHRGHAPAHTQR